MNSEAAGTGPVKDYPGWARAVRKDRLPSRREEHLKGIEEFFDHYSADVETWRRRNSGYHRAIASLARFYIPANAMVLEVGSGSGDLLAELQPRRGVGIDISGEMVRLASARHPDLEFHRMAAEDLDLGDEKFDYVVLSDLTGFLYDIRQVFERLRSVSHSQTRVIIHWYSMVWQPILSMAERVGLKYPQPIVNWTTREDLTNLLYLADFEVVQGRPHILLPKQIPVVSTLVNRFLAPLPLIRALALTNWLVARPMRLQPERPASVSVI